MFKRQPKPEQPILPQPQESPSHSASHDESNWLISYADMMTLLCGFFIMLFSMCKLDNPQYDSFKEALSKQFGGEYVSATKDLALFATQILQQLGIEKDAIIKADASGVSIAFQSTVFFDTLSAQLTPDGRNILDQVISKVKDRQQSTGKLYRYVVEGHTDSRPVISGGFASNWELSGARASRVVRLFIDHGFDPTRLTAMAYADTHPQIPHEQERVNGKWDEAALAQNRRVVLRILEPPADSIPVPESPGTQSSGANSPSGGPSTPPPSTGSSSNTAMPIAGATAPVATAQPAANAAPPAIPAH